jgi:DNA-binding FadR family transcriptional regulator
LSPASTPPRDHPSLRPGDGRFPRARDASEQIALAIRSYIEENDLRPGDRIGTEHQVADEFGVSRPTLREALRLLAGSHLIRVSQGRGGGIFVESTPNEGMSRSVSESIATMLASKSVSLTELLDARMLLEVPLARLAAARAPEQTVRDLQAAIADAEGRPPESEEFRLADTRFHETLAHAAGNDLLVAFTRWTLEVLQPSLIEHIGTHIDGARIIEQHWAIVRAVQRGRPAAAENAMRRHLGYVADVLREVDAGTRRAGRAAARSPEGAR